MPVYAFGPGSLYGINSAAGSTPRRFGGLQEATIDLSFTTKELFGGYQFPLDIARGQGKITGKAKVAAIDAALFNDIYFGQSLVTTDVNQVATDEAGTIPSSTAYTVTVANSATWTEDLGVVYAATGVAFQKVTAGSEAAGSYSVAAGVYTFSAGDSGVAVKLNYMYTLATGGSQLALTNQLIGTTPVFQAVFQTVNKGRTLTWTFPKCTSSKLSLATKLDDYEIPELDFSAFADDGGNVVTITTV